MITLPHNKQSSYMCTLNRSILVAIHILNLQTSFADMQTHVPDPLNNCISCISIHLRKLRLSYICYIQYILSIPPVSFSHFLILKINQGIQTHIESDRTPTMVFILFTSMNHNLRIINLKNSSVPQKYDKLHFWWTIFWWSVVTIHQ